MIRCEGQKAECYQSSWCHFCQSSGGARVADGMPIEMFDESMNWGSSILVWMIYFGVGLFLIGVGFLAAKVFN